DHENEPKNMASGRTCRSSNRAEVTAPQYHHNVGRLTSDVTHRRTIDACARAASRHVPPHGRGTVLAPPCRGDCDIGRNCFSHLDGSHRSIDAPYQLIGQFLREHPDVFCVDCLAEAIEPSPTQVSMATQRLLAGEAAFAARLDVCSRCARRPLVLRAAAYRI